MFRVIVDADTCESNAFCIGFAPDEFELGDDAPPVRVVLETAGEDRRSAIEEAVMNCPKQAIHIETAGFEDGSFATDEEGTGNQLMVIGVTLSAAGIAVLLS